MANTSTTIDFTGYTMSDDHVEYKIVVNNKNGQSHEMKARYKQLRKVYKALKEKFGSSALPSFPKKKFMGNTSDDFIRKRQKGLESFFNSILKSFRIDQIEPLTSFFRVKEEKVEDKKEVIKKEPKPSIQPVVVPVREEKKIDVEAIVRKHKNAYLDLTNNPAPMDYEELTQKKELYKNLSKMDNLKLEGYELPKGNESNLISIHDESMPTHNRDVHNLVSSTLDSIAQDCREMTSKCMVDFICRY